MNLYTSLSLGEPVTLRRLRALLVTACAGMLTAATAGPGGWLVAGGTDSLTLLCDADHHQLSDLAGRCWREHPTVRVGSAA